MKEPFSSNVFSNAVIKSSLFGTISKLFFLLIFSGLGNVDKGISEDRICAIGI